MKLLFISALFFCAFPIALFAQNADIIFINANVITASKKGAYYNAMAIKDGKIMYVGERSNALKYKTNQTRVIDLNGESIIPGFNDVHLHPNPETKFNELDHILKLDTVTSIQSLLSLLSKKASITPKGMLIRARGYNESKLGIEPTCLILDKGSSNQIIPSIYRMHLVTNRWQTHIYCASIK